MVQIATTMLQPLSGDFEIRPSLRIRLRGGIRVCLLAVLLGPAITFQARADTATGLSHFQKGEFAEAQEDWRAAALTGDPDAALFLGVAYDVGEGVVRSGTDAARWYTRAARLGNVNAMFNLGVTYDAGSDVPKDANAAIVWYSRAADRRYARAEYNLGLIYEDGTGTPKDRDRAIQWFTRAAADGAYAARGHLTLLGKRPISTAFRATGPKQAGDPAGDPGMRAFQNAEAAFLGRSADATREAVRLFKSSAEQNNALAAYDLAYCYEHSIGVPRDMRQAYHWYHQAAHTATDDSLRGIASSSAEKMAHELGSADFRDATN